MEAYEQILVEAFSAALANILSEVQLDRVVELRCYYAIREIQQILSKEEYDDAECFWRIERIVLTLEQIGLSAGSRHDF